MLLQLDFSDFTSLNVNFPFSPTGDNISREEQVYIVVRFNPVRNTEIPESASHYFRTRLVPRDSVRKGKKRVLAVPSIPLKRSERVTRKISPLRVPT